MAKKKRKNRKKSRYKGVTEISVCGFKSLSCESRAEILPLTIFAGANSSGKSSIMQALLLLKQTLEASYDAGPLLMNGPNARFTSTDQFISRFPGSRRAFSVQIVTSDDVTNKIEFCVTDDNELEIGYMAVDVVFDDGEERAIVLTPTLGQKELETALSAFIPEIKEVIRPGFRLTVERERCFLSIRPVRLEEKGGFFLVPSLSGLVSRELHRMIHVPGLRGNPERVYNRTAPGPLFPGTFEGYVATIIADWQKSGTDHVARLEEMLSSLGLTSQVVAQGINDTQIELQVGRLPESRPTAADYVNIADVGFGVSQVLPVLVALLVAEEGQLVYVEQPELHLHPRAEYGLARIMADAASRGVKLVVETHSALFLLHVRTLMATGDLDPDVVKLHWFSRDTRDGATVIHSGVLDEIGSFGDWPEDFGNVELTAEGAYLDAVERRSRENGKAAQSKIGN